ncbi:GSCOCG00005578001-RA-CDS, partial [Cotesia congregata]
AAHTILGFIGSFSANFPCRFCKIHRSDINSTFKESSCELRSEEIYKVDLEKNEPSETGIAGPSVFETHLKTASTIDLMTVDVMHDLLEGICEYDFGLIMHHFIVVKKFFTLTNINNRIEGLYYGDESRNKPRTLKPNQIKTRFIKMSASESRCILENIGVLIGDWVPRKNLHWRLVILIKEIFDIVSATVIHKGISYYLTNLIGEYLHLLSILFPGSLKPKHHYMLHYATIMERKGPLWNMNCMRPESKNRDSKITSRITLNRTNISKTLAIKSQLILNHRLRNRLVSNKLYESNKSTLKSVPELQEYCSYAKLLSFSLSDKVTEFDFITFRGKDIQKNVILMMLTESDRCFFNVHAIFEDNANTLFIVPKDITEFIYY